MNVAPVFDSRQIRLTPLIVNQDAPLLASWTRQLDVARRFRSQSPLRSLSEFEVRQVLEEWLKESQQPNHSYLFAVRPLAEERLVGYIRISQLMWVHGVAQFDLVIGDPADWVLFADAALRLGLKYAFDEMNLFRVSVEVEEHHELSRELYTAAQFSLEVRQRQAIFHQGRYWDRLMFGLLRPEWIFFQRQQQGVAA